VAAPLTPARREELLPKVYERSLRGVSAREIGREFGISHKTVISYLQKEAQRRRAEHPDYRQYALDSHREAVRRTWDELDKNPSPHAAAQLIHALNTSLNSIELITGVRAPTKSQAEVLHKDALDAFEPHRLSWEELTAFEMLLKKSMGETDEDTDVLAEIIRQYETGELQKDDPDKLLELEPVEEE
jgi:IS30 family transposase